MRAQGRLVDQNDNASSRAAMSQKLMLQAAGCTSWDPALQQALNLDKLLMRHIILMQTVHRDSTHAAPCSMRAA